MKIPTKIKVAGHSVAINILSLGLQGLGFAPGSPPLGGGAVTRDNKLNFLDTQEY